MSLSEFIFPSILLFCMLGVAYVSFNIGWTGGRDEAADDAISDNPPKRWKSDLIDAEARKKRLEIS